MKSVEEFMKLYITKSMEVRQAEALIEKCRETFRHVAEAEWSAPVGGFSADGELVTWPTTQDVEKLIHQIGSRKLEMESCVNALREHYHIDLATLQLPEPTDHSHPTIDKQFQTS